MQRDIAKLTGTTYDVLVVGGGVHGACAAWEAALRGLTVALIEAGDFAQETSSNSLRTMHGGLRYLQQLDFGRMRESIKERREWLRLAPELVHPMRFVLPTIGRGLRAPPALQAALALNDLVSMDRNRGIGASHRLPHGAVVRGASARSLLSPIVCDSNGVAWWYDAVCESPERLVLALVEAAVARGAVAANYVRAVEIIECRHIVQGVRVRDEVSGQMLEVRARTVINATGPRVDGWLPQSHDHPLFRASKAFNLLVKPMPLQHAVGASVPMQGGVPSTVFFIPWRGRVLVGTRHLRCDASARTADVTPDEVSAFIDDLNTVLGARKLATSDVLGVFSGLLPEARKPSRTEVTLERHAQVITHRELPGLISIVGVKWTTARAVAERAVRIACKNLRRSSLPVAARTLSARLNTGASHASRIEPSEIARAVEHEMALRLWDVVRRRTELYLCETLDYRTLRSCAAVMARQLGWSRARVEQEVAHAIAELERFRGALPGHVSPGAHSQAFANFS